MISRQSVSVFTDLTYPFLYSRIQVNLLGQVIFCVIVAVGFVLRKCVVSYLLCLNEVSLLTHEYASLAV
jgi:hypothetical protein